MRCLYAGCWLNNIGHLLWEECQVIWGIQVHHSIILCYVPSTIPVKQVLFKGRGRDLVICAQGAIYTLRWLSLLRRLQKPVRSIFPLSKFSPHSLSCQTDTTTSSSEYDRNIQNNKQTEHEDYWWKLRHSSYLMERRKHIGYYNLQIWHWVSFPDPLLTHVTKAQLDNTFIVGVHVSSSHTMTYLTHCR